MILIAGIGNLFLGDDGFGVEVVHRLFSQDLPPQVRACDYGIRGVHLAYDLLDGAVDTLILIDALPTGEAPGTVTLLEVDDAARAELAASATTIDSHAMHPEAVLATLQALGGSVRRILLVGCQPASVEPGIGLSAPVRAAVPTAADLAFRTASEVVAHA